MGFDEDGDKTLSETEFEALVNYVHVHTPVVAPEDITQGCGLLFDTYDADDDLQLAREEIAAFLKDQGFDNADLSGKQLRKLTYRLGMAYDADYDGIWQWSEVEAICEDLFAIEELIEEEDEQVEEEEEQIEEEEEELVEEEDLEVEEEIIEEEEELEVE